MTICPEPGSPIPPSEDSVGGIDENDLDKQSLLVLSADGSGSEPDAWRLLNRIQQKDRDLSRSVALSHVLMAAGETDLYRALATCQALVMCLVSATCRGLAMSPVLGTGEPVHRVTVSLCNGQAPFPLHRKVPTAPQWQSLIPGWVRARLVPRRYRRRRGSPGVWGSPGSSGDS